MRAVFFSCMHGRARGARCGEAIRGGGLWAGRQIKNEPPARVRRGTGCASRGYGAWDRKRGTAEEGGGVRSRRRKIGGSWLAVSFVLFYGAWIAASAAVAHQRGRQVGGAGQRARRAPSEQGWEEGGCVGEVERQQRLGVEVGGGGAGGEEEGGVEQLGVQLLKEGGGRGVGGLARGGGRGRRGGGRGGRRRRRRRRGGRLQLHRRRHVKLEAGRGCGEDGVDVVVHVVIGGGVAGRPRGDAAARPQQQLH